MPGEPDRFDLIVVGAGINGAGIARDAAFRGLRVLLLDKGDIASGTTSWSTRLIHGGLRYLEHREFGLVRESLTERETLLRIAPHLVRPLPLLIPIYRGDQRGPFLIRAGMIAYDLLSRGTSLPRHRLLGRRAALRRAPGLAKRGLRGAALYHDGQVEHAERLAVENVLDAVAHGASVGTYHDVEEILVAVGRVSGVSGRDALTGEPFRFPAPVVVNVTGPWVDEVLAATSNVPRLIGGTKGSHIVVAPFSGAPRDALYAESRRDGRPFFIIPWNGLYLIGTTDTRYDGDLDRVVADEWEIDLLLAETNRVIQNANLTREDVLYTYAGIRPLPFAPGEAESRVTRRHQLRDHAATGGPRGLFSIVGGKLTTYRELAEQTVDLVLKVLVQDQGSGWGAANFGNFGNFGNFSGIGARGRRGCAAPWPTRSPGHAPGRPVVPARTATTPLPGARAGGTWLEFAENFMADSGLSPQSADHLLRVYGTRAADLLATASTPDLREVFDPLTGAIAAEVPWAFQQEGASTLADAIARRTMTGLNANAGIGADVAAAQIARRTLGWSAERAAREVDAYRRWVSRYRPRALDEAATG